MMVQPLLPWWLVAIVGVAALTLVVLMAIRHPLRSWSWVRRGLMLVLVLLICLRPGLAGAGESGPAKATDLDVFFVVDVTMSMSAQDHTEGQSRLAGAQQDIEALAVQSTGARFSIMEFGREAYVDLPLTTDASALKTAVELLRWESDYYATGTSIDRPLDQLAKALQAAKQAHPDRQRVVYYLGDGEQTAEGAPRSFAGLAPYITGGAVLGYGTTGGGKMPEREADDETPGSAGGYLTGPDGADAVSRVDERALRKVADELGVSYQHRVGPGGLSAPKGKSTVTEADRGERPLDLELYWMLAIGLGLLAIWELWHLVRLVTVTVNGRRWP